MDIKVKAYVALVQPDSSRSETGGAFVIVGDSDNDRLVQLRDWLKGTYGEEVYDLDEVIDTFDEHGFDVELEEHKLSYVVKVEVLS